MSVNEVISSTVDIEYGVPQGSNLGPILFSIYVTDFFNTYDSAPVLYADDTCIKVEAETTNDLELLLNQAIEKASNWMKANKLTINAAKSNIMIINSTRGGSSKGTAGLQPPQNIPTVIYFCTKLIIIIDHDSTELKIRRNLAAQQKQRVPSP